jgi:hypothetical protein
MTIDEEVELGLMYDPEFIETLCWCRDAARMMRDKIDEEIRNVQP